MSLPSSHTENGVSPADLLVSAIEEQRPIVLILGQDAWCESKGGDTVLVKALGRLGRDRISQRGWSTLLGAEAVPKEFYDWLAERFARRVHPPSLEVLTQLPWSAVFTSSLDPTLKGLLEGRGRQPAVILTANEVPPAARSRARPPLYHLFSRAGEHDPKALPPASRPELNSRRTKHAVTLLNRVLETATTLGLVVVDGFASGHDWLKIDDLLGVLGGAALRQVIWFGGQPRIDGELVHDFDAAVKSNRIVVEPRRLGTLIAELRALDRLPDPLPDAEAPGLIGLGDGRYLKTTPEERLRVEAVASIVDDSWTEFLAPLGEDSEYATFRRFHGAVEGTRLLVEGVRRDFAIERDFERQLLRRVSTAIANHAKTDTPLMVEGQSGTGKSVALARAVVYARERKRIPVLYAIGRIPRSREVFKFCESADAAGASTTLIVCDANRDVDEYYELLIGLRSLGRRVVVLGSQYRKGERTGDHSYVSVEAPARLSDGERDRLHELLDRYLDLHDRDVWEAEHILAFLYRYLPASRARISVGLGAEARSAAGDMRSIGRLSRPVKPITLLHQRLIEAGILPESQPLLDESLGQAAADSEDMAIHLIDFVMLAGSLSCEVPVNLLIRAVTKRNHDIDLSPIVGLFRNLDLFRWNDDTLFVRPRLTLEAEVLCRSRFGGADVEAARLLELIESVRDGGIDSRRDERRFLIDLLRQLGPDGICGRRYQSAYVKIARALTKLRKEHGTVDAGLMIQESAFRRYAVRHQEVDEHDCLPLLEEARDVIQLALDGVEDGSIDAGRKTKDNLLVERATIYGYLARNRADHGSAEDAWSAYEAARTAVRKAVSVTSAYYPLDIGLWTPSDLLASGALKEWQVDLRADMYSTLDQVEPASLSPQQRERFHERQLKVGTVLGDYHLTDRAFSELEASGSTAGYFLQARGLISHLSRDADVIDTPGEIDAAKRAAQFLSGHFEKIKDDQRCLRLLLECRWIVETGRWPFRGRRQPLPFDHAKRHDLLAIVQALNVASGHAAQHLPRYLEAMLTWLTGDERSAIRMFRALDRDTEHESGGRVISRHMITGIDGTPCRFQGRVERDRGKGHWTVRVEGIDRYVDLLSRSFPHDEIAYGRTIRDFGISFNFIGPIADPVR